MAISYNKLWKLLVDRILTQFLELTYETIDTVLGRNCDGRHGVVKV